MPKLTVLDVKNSRIPAVLGICPTDPRFLQWLNEFLERIIISGKFWGFAAKFQICATDSCLTLPPQIATIEAVNVCGNPTPVRDFWWEFLQNGFGSIPDANGSCSSGNGCVTGCGYPEAIMRGEYPTFSDIIGVNKKLNFICDLATDVGKTVLALGYDENGNWIRTLQSGVYADGEVIAFAQSGGTLSTKLFSSVTGIQLPSNMDGQSWLYEYNTSDTTKRMIGKYQYWETRPSYPRYFFPSVRPTSTNGTCNTVKVEVMAKLQYIPVKADTDYVMVACLPAIKEGMRAIKLAENEPDSLKSNAIINAGIASARAILDQQLDHQFGSGRKIGINVLSSSLGSVDPVPTLI